MLTDIQIAQSVKPRPIWEIAAKLGIGEDDLELYGRYKAKINLVPDENVSGKRPGLGRRPQSRTARICGSQ